MDILNHTQTVIGLSLLIILHELGHYLVARWCGMRVQKFSVGFGPTLFGRKVGETFWQIAAVPLGGYVQIDGMGPRQDDEPEEDDRSFRNKAVWQRMLVIFAGPATNWLLAALFIFALASTVGVTQVDPASTGIGEVVTDTAAERAGLQVGDRVLSLDGAPVTSWAMLVEKIQKHPETALVAEIERAGAVLTITITPSSEDGVGRLGIGPLGETVRVGVVGGMQMGVTWAWQNTGRYAGLLWGMLVGTREGKLSGIPGIVAMISQQAKRGMREFLETLAWLSIGLFLLNLAPIPALDGGRLVFLGIETVRGKPVDEKIEGIVHGVGFVLLFGLIIIVSVRDLL